MSTFVLANMQQRGVCKRSLTYWHNEKDSHTRTYILFNINAKNNFKDDYRREKDDAADAGVHTYAKTRSLFRYSAKGDLIEKRFPVWTAKGQAYIKKLITGKTKK